MSTETNNPFDKKTIVAILLVGLVWMGWQMYMEHKYGSQKLQPVAAAPAAGSNVGTRESLDSTTSGGVANVNSAVAAPAVHNEVDSAAKDTSEESQVTAKPVIKTAFSAPELQLNILNRGFAIQDVLLKTYTDRSGAPIRLGDTEEAVFAICDRATGVPLDFAVSKIGEDRFQGVYNKGGLQIAAELTLRPAQYAFDYTINVKKIPEGFKGLTVRMLEKIGHTEGGSFLMPSFEFNEAVVVAEGSTERTRLVRDESVTKNFEKVSVLGLGSHYFGIAALDNSDVLPNALYKSQGSLATGELEYAPLPGSQTQAVNIKGFMGPKSLGLVSSVDERLIPLVNFGALSWLARPILWLMKWLYSLIHNYGVAIILLTLIVRLLVLPFNVMSFKSMKAMQVVQPQIKALRERYKDDPQQLNLQMMSLMRTNKVNPLGGCLPMLLQLPVFFALYQVLGQSIELYKAPFAFWIHDLSSKDPYYVLPTLMGVAMFLQQKFTPTTMDPAQAKVMQFLPVVFAFLMITLPSGLTLYIFVSTLFGIFQQLVFMRDRTLQVAPAQS